MKLSRLLLTGMACSMVLAAGCDNSKYSYDVDRLKNKYQNDRMITETFKLDQQEFGFKRELRNIPEAVVTRNNKRITVTVPTWYVFHNKQSTFKHQGQTFMNKLARVVTHFKDATLYVSEADQSTVSTKRTTAIRNFMVNKRFPATQVITAKAHHGETITFTLKNAPITS